MTSSTDLSRLRDTARAWRHTNQAAELLAHETRRQIGEMARAGARPADIAQAIRSPRIWVLEAIEAYEMGRT